MSKTNNEACACQQTHHKAKKSALRRGLDAAKRFLGIGKRRKNKATRGSKKIGPKQIGPKQVQRARKVRRKR